MNEETVAVRAYTVPKLADFKPKKGLISKFKPERELFWDTETTTDLYQNLKIGYFEIYQNGKLEHAGLFYDPKIVKNKEKKILEEHSKQLQIKIYTLEEFRQIFLYEVYDLQTLCVGFNLPFDLTRIAIKSSNARFRRKNGFSLEISKNLHYPRLHVTHVTSTLSFTEWGNTKNRQKRFKGNFLDLRTLCHALTDKKHSLESACIAFKTVFQKTKVKEHGKITPEYIQYCINDVKSTYSLYLKTKEEFDSYNLEIPITKAYTPASIGKEFLRSMGVRSFQDKNQKFPKELMGNIMTSYFGGRTECKIRKTPTKVDVLDFLSMYPTVCILQNLWRFVIASHIEYREATSEITNFINGFKLEGVQDRKNWTRLQGIVLVEPQEDILPMRARYGEKNVWNIGLNHVTSKTPLWYSLADVLASKLYTRKTPIILKAFWFTPVGVQKGLKTIDIHGIKINPYKQDLFKELIEYRKRLQKANDPREHIIKIIVNAISYGIFVEIVTLEESKKIPIDVYGLSHFTENKNKIEKFGFMFNPILAVSITSASRLLLAVTEILLAKHDTTHAYCDTDSMMVPPEHTREIQKFYKPLNPYSFDAEIFKLEMPNVWFYGISAKRYCLYTKEKDQIIIPDDGYSSHGLGHLFDPISNEDNKDWNKDVWKDILDLHYGNVIIEQLMEKYENKYALSRLAITSPRIRDRLKEFNKNNDYRKQIKPFNFSILGFSNERNENTDELVKPLAPFVKPAKHAVHNYFVDYNDKTRHKLRGKQYWKPFWDTFREYLIHPESKFDGNVGVLGRKHVTITKIVHIGKESNNLDESEVLGTDSDSYHIYEDVTGLDSKFDIISGAILRLCPKDAKKLGISKQSLWNIKFKIRVGNSDRISAKLKMSCVNIESIGKL